MSEFTIAFISQLLTYDSGIGVCPAVVTYATPHSIETDLQPSLRRGVRVNQSYIIIIANRSCGVFKY